MSVNILNKYIKICLESNMKPTIDGLIKFKGELI